MKKYIRPLSLFAVLSIFLFNILFSFFTPKLQAQSENLAEQVRREARLFTVTNALVACFQGDTGPGLSSETTTDKLSSELPVFINLDITVGHHVKPSDGKSNCNDAAWVASAVDIAGINSNTDFMNLFYEKAGNGNLWDLKSEVASEKTNAVNTFLKKASEGGNTMITCTPKVGCKVNPLSDAARYVLLLENLKRGCKATPAGGNADTLNSIDADHKAVIKIVDNQGNITEQTYELELERARFISVGQGVTNDGNYKCDTIINLINDLAPAYAERAKRAKDSGQEVGDVDTVTEPEGSGGENAKSCEEQFGLSTGWLVCAALELISNGVDKLAGYADSLLNLDAQRLYSNDGLRTAWSYFRAIATFLLFAVGLVIIIGQAVGGSS